MPMSNKVSDSGEIPPGQGGLDEGQSLSLKLLVQEGRTAATKGLLHDFSNVMVGLCSLSENALDETEPGSALHDDMEIIRDSAVRAHQLIRRLARLNTTDIDQSALMDLGAWLANEADSIRSVLPKGSEVTLGKNGKTLLVMVRESTLRDFIMTITAKVASAARKRLIMEMMTGDAGEECVLRIKFGNSPAGQSPSALPRSSSPDGRILEHLARGLGGRCAMANTSGGGLLVELFLPKA